MCVQKYIIFFNFQILNFLISNSVRFCMGIKSNRLGIWNWSVYGRETMKLIKVNYILHKALLSKALLSIWHWFNVEMIEITSVRCQFDVSFLTGHGSSHHLPGRSYVHIGGCFSWNRDPSLLRPVGKFQGSYNTLDIVPEFYSYSEQQRNVVKYLRLIKYLCQSIIWLRNRIYRKINFFKFERNLLSCAELA